ncbi:MULTISPECIES: PaaI family thioesterase [Pacificibacter]|uniref:PaaI family thioesterase n=1 Tax=Pacificibacter TaxID=1042323 RepID=UPI001C088EB8|nr:MULTISPECIES: PaaI family thioesterase [Pacificibacter]MBU2935902.1 PaaI family thioesterase [Pacificibacter marinus]MDO6614397.1 PaaI family thioesterase [Pacificibacter sp. 1_MG-2023]
MTRATPEPVQVIKTRRNSALEALKARVPYAAYLGVEFERHGDELTTVLPYRADLVGNPALQALHGGATAAFLEITAQVVLSWSVIWPLIEAGGAVETVPVLPKTIDLSVDYLRSGLPRDAYARAKITRAGRRFSSVHVHAWQDNVDRPFAMATGHFMMPDHV